MCKKRLVRLYESLLSAISRRTMKFLLLGARVVMLWAERRPRLEGVTFEDTAASEFPGQYAWRHRNGHGHNNGHDASDSPAISDT